VKKYCFHVGQKYEKGMDKIKFQKTNSKLAELKLYTHSCSLVGAVAIAIFPKKAQMFERINVQPTILTIHVL
jgi:hypothetical protein